MAKPLSEALNLKQLRSFYAVAQAGGFGRAERLLSVQQPAITKMIRALERSLGAELFTRSRQGSRLTPVGQALLAHCERVFLELSQIDRLAEAKSGSPRGELHLGANEHVAAYLLPSILAALRRSAPQLAVRVYTGPASLLIEEIVDGRLELGLFFRARPSPKIEKLLLARVPCQLVVAPAFAREQSVLESFIGSREIDDTGNKSFPTLAMLKKKRPRTAITLSCNSLEAHKQLVKAGGGVSILPRFVVEEDLRRGDLLVLHPEYEYSASLELVGARGRKLSTNAHALLAPLKRALRARGWKE